MFVEFAVYVKLLLFYIHVSCNCNFKQLSKKHLPLNIYHLIRHLPLNLNIRPGVLERWLKLPVWKVGDRPALLFRFQRNKCFFPAHLQRCNIVGSLHEMTWRARPQTARVRIANSGCLVGSVISSISPSSGSTSDPG